MKRVYMISQGEYSGYMVGGLYESELELTETKVMSLIPEMVKEQFPELSGDDAYNLSLSSSWSTGNAISEHFLGPQPCPSSNREQWSNWYDRKIELLRDKDLKLSNYLLRKNILKRIDYQEIHLDEGWI